MKTEIRPCNAARIRSMLKFTNEQLEAHYAPVKNAEVITLGAEMIHSALQEKMRTVVVVLCIPLESSSSK